LINGIFIRVSRSGDKTRNRLHKLLTDAGIRLGVVVSDLHGQSARAMVTSCGFAMI